MILEEILSAISSVERRKAAFFAIPFVMLVVAVGGVIGMLFSLSDPTMQDTAAVPMWVVYLIVLMGLVFVAVFAVFVGKQLWCNITSAKNPKQSQVWQQLVATGNEGLFVSTIDEEVNGVDAINHVASAPRFIRYWLTPGWIIIISAGGSVIHRREALKDVTARARDTHTGASNRTNYVFYLHLEFVDGTSARVSLGPKDEKAV